MNRLFITPLLVGLTLGIALTVLAGEREDALLKKASAVLAQLEGEIKLAGIQEPVEVLRDRWGVAHIYARNADDLFFAQGFVAAQDRLFQLDVWRRVSSGETAELVGKPGLQADRFARLLKYRGDMFAEWSSYSPDTRQIAHAFTTGINACIDHIGDRLPVEFQVLGTRPGYWRPEDCLGRMSGIYMSRNFQTELARAELVAAVGIDKARRISPTDPPRAFAPAPGLDLAGIDRSVLASYTEALKPLAFKPSADDGSNNWAIDGTLSASGKPMLASDPHRAIALPSLRYLVHLNAPGWNVIGSGEPGLPGVAIGHNDRVAWGFTIVGTDQADVYVEETNPSNPTEYRVGDAWQTMKIVREKVAVRGEAQPAELELRFTRHGPVIHEDAKRHRAYALKWAGSEPGGAAYLRSLALDRVKNGREFVKALAGWKIPSLNMVYADVDGNIGWVAAALTPVRKNWDGLLPVPGAQGAYEWQGFLPVDELPQLHNPAHHHVATANHNILPADYKREIAYEWAPRYRFARIEERLNAEKKFTLEDFQSIQHDNTSLPALALARLLANVDVLDAKLQPHADLLARWDGVLTAGSRAGALYAVWLQELLAGFYRPHVPAGLLEFATSRSGVPVMLAALEKPDTDWFGAKPAEARDRLMRTALRNAVTRLKELLPGDELDWSWGRLHTTTFRHPLASLSPAHAKAFNLGPVPSPGDAHTPNAASHTAKFEHISGASYRHVFDLADWDKGLATSAPGQSGQPGSPHYGDLLTLWNKGEYFPLAFSRAKVEQVTRHRLKLSPAAQPAAPKKPAGLTLPVRTAKLQERPTELLLHGDRLFVSSFYDGAVVALDARTLHRQQTLTMDSTEYYRPRWTILGWPIGEERKLRRWPAGSIAVAAGRLFVCAGSGDMVVYDLPSLAVVKRLHLNGRTFVVTRDGRTLFCANAAKDELICLDTKTYEHTTIPYPPGGRGIGALALSADEKRLYLGIQRGGLHPDGKVRSGGNAFLAVYDRDKRAYSGTVYLARTDEHGGSDDSVPYTMLLSADAARLYIGMFQSVAGIQVVDLRGMKLEANLGFDKGSRNKHFSWADPLALAWYRDWMLVVNRNNQEVMVLDRATGKQRARLQFLDVGHEMTKLAVGGDSIYICDKQHRAVHVLDGRDLARLLADTAPDSVAEITL